MSGTGELSGYAIDFPLIPRLLPQGTSPSPVAMIDRRRGISLWREALPIHPFRRALIETAFGIRASNALMSIMSVMSASVLTDQEICDETVVCDPACSGPDNGL